MPARDPVRPRRHGPIGGLGARSERPAGAGRVGRAALVGYLPREPTNRGLVTLVVGPNSSSSDVRGSIRGSNFATVGRAAGAAAARVAGAIGAGDGGGGGDAGRGASAGRDARPVRRSCA